MSRDYIPVRDADLNNWLTVLLDYVTANADRFGIATEAITSLRDAAGRYSGAFSVVKMPTSNTSGAVKEKNEARAEAVARVRKFVNEHLRFNSLVTDQDRVNMQLSVRDTTPTPVPVPTSMLEYTVTPGIRSLSINYRNAGSKSKAKPQGVMGAVIRWAVLDSQPASINELVNSELDTRTPFTLTFDEPNRGRRIYFVLAWQNTRGEKGPWSEIGMAIIP